MTWRARFRGSAIGDCCGQRATCCWAICLLDLGSTVYLISAGHAIEANPLLGAYLAMGLEWFLVAKAVLFALVPIGLVEWLRERCHGREHRLRLILRGGLAAYCALYILGLAAVNLG